MKPSNGVVEEDTSVPSGDRRNPKTARQMSPTKKQNQGEKKENRPNPNSCEVQGRRKGERSRRGKPDSYTQPPKEAETVTPPEAVEDGSNKPPRGDELETESLHREVEARGAQDTEPPADQHPHSVTRGKQRMEAEAPVESPLVEGSPLTVNDGVPRVELPTDLARGHPSNQGGVPSTPEPCSSGMKRTPVQTLTGDQHTEKETNKHPMEGLETDEESTGTNLVPAPYYMNNTEKLRGPQSRCEGSSLSDSPETTQRGAIPGKGASKRSLKGSEGQTPGGTPKKQRLEESAHRKYPES